MVGSKEQFAVPWQVALHAAEGSWAGESPSKLLVPRGYSWIELKAGVSFEPNPEGLRQIYSRRNGTDARSQGYRAGYLSHTQPPGGRAAGPLSFTAHSAIMPVEPGDYFELMVYQDSGSPLCIAGPPDAGRQQPSELRAYGGVFLEAQFW
jgi:hypothetical protein